MRWSGGRRSGNIEDRRGMGGAAVGGVGAGGLVIAAIAYFVFGASPEQALQIAQGTGGGAVESQQGVEGSPQDEAGSFVDVIETSNDDVWSQLISNYRPPAGVVLYDRATGTACGAGQAAMGPFYCPNDQKVYLDLSFWNELETTYGAKGDFARAYVIAHEMGHHVQNLTGQFGRGESLGSQGATSGSVRTELQADCYAGVWAAHAPQVSNISIDPSDIESGMAAATGVGDDTLQRQSGGRVAPDTFTHGTSEQRVRWFRRGVDSGDPASCDTFSAQQL